MYYNLINSMKRVSASSYLLDTYSGASAGYSLRKLSSTYSGSCIRVRRSSDNAEQDFGFVSNALDTSSLLTFVGANNGFVTTWYDQSGNGNNAIQSTALLQPKIVSTGSVVLTNSKPAINFSDENGFNYLRFSSNFSTFNNTSIFSLFAPSTYSGAAVNARFYDLYDGTNHIQYLRDASTNSLRVRNKLWQTSTESTQFTTQNPPITQFLSSILALSSSNDLYYNNTIQSKITAFNVGDGGSVGVIGQRGDILTVTQFIGNYQELIIYQTNQSSNVTSIDININNYYGIY